MDGSCCSKAVQYGVYVLLGFAESYFAANVYDAEKFCKSFYEYLLNVAFDGTTVDCPVA